MSNEATVGDRIRKRRETVGLTQADLAKAVGAHKMTVSKWERNTQTPRGKNLSRVAEALHTSVAALKGREGDPVISSVAKAKADPNEAMGRGHLLAIAVSAEEQELLDVVAAVDRMPTALALRKHSLDDLVKRGRALRPKFRRVVSSLTGVEAVED